MTENKQWYLLAKKELNPTNNGEMNYCPYCLKQVKEDIKGTSKTIKDCLNPVTYHKFLHVSKMPNGDDVKTIEEVWKCGKCKRNLSPDDWINSYCLNADGTKRNTEKTNERIDAI